MPTNTVITDAGITAAINAGTLGPLIEVSAFKVGSNSQAQGYTPAVTDTNVSGLVYTGSLAQMSYSVISNDSVLYRVLLEHDVGPFQVGNIGLFLTGNTMFTISALVQQQSKTVTSGLTPGNRMVFDIVVRLSNLANISDLTILMAQECSLPRVPTELSLPDPDTAPYNCYIVDNHTQIGRTCLATRFNSAWHFAVQRTLAGAGQTILATPNGSADFHADAAIGKIVYFNVSDKLWRKADPSDPRKSPFGIRSSSYEITVLGYYEAPSGTPYTVGVKYYVATDGTAEPTTEDTGFEIGVSLTNKKLWVNFANSSSLNRYSQPINRFYTKTEIKKSLGTTYEAIYTCPAGIRTVVWGVRVVNKNNSPDTKFDCYIDYANSATDIFWAANHIIPRQATIDLCPPLHPRVLREGDVLYAKAEVAARLNIFVTVQETTDTKIFNPAVQLNDNTYTQLMVAPKKSNVFSLVLVNRHPVLNLPVTVAHQLPDGTVDTALNSTIVVPCGGSVDVLHTELVLEEQAKLFVQTTFLGYIDASAFGRIIP